jgi:hypothetical protein
MSVNTPFIGRLGQAYAKVEATYAADVVLAATDAFRHLDLGLVYSPRNRKNASDRLMTPDLRRRITQRATASFDVRQALMWPSGTLNTPPELDLFLTHGLGARTNVTLATTFAPKPPVAALDAVAGLVTSGTHSWKVTFSDAIGETKPSAKSNVLTTVEADHGKATLTIPKGPTGTIKRTIYRTIAGDTGPWKKVADVSDNTTVTYQDNIADGAFGVDAPAADTSMLLTTTGGFVADAGTLAVGDAVLITRNSVKYPRFVTAVSTTNLTWAPALPTAVMASEALKGGVTYKPATNPASSITIAHYLAMDAGGGAQTFTRELKGCVVDKLTMDFDANEEPTISLSGPARNQVRPAQATPGAFTTIGTAIPSGISGELLVSGTAYPFLKAQIGLINEMVLRNAEYGTSQANGFYRRGRRVVDISIDAYVEDPAPLYAFGESTVTVPILLQTGMTEGQIWAVYCPLVEFELPTTPDNLEELQWSFKGIALGNNGNDEVYLAAL